MPSNTHWTSEEIKYLISKYETTLYKEIASFLNKTPSSVFHKAKRLGLKKPLGPQPGNIFGRLTIIQKTDLETRSGNPYYRCLCQCGKEHTVSNGDLTTGKISSCGCLRKETHSLPPGKVTINHQYTNYKRGAIGRDLDFYLTIEEFVSITSQICHYCGSNPYPKNFYLNGHGEKTKAARISNISQESIDRSWVNMNGLDRIDNGRGYSRDNCVPCCTRCNISKMDELVDDFIAHSRKIVAHQDRVIKRI